MPSVRIRFPADTRLMPGSHGVTAGDGFGITSPTISRPEPDAHVAQGYDFCDFAVAAASDAIAAIDAGTPGQKVKPAPGELHLPAGSLISHPILTHPHPAGIADDRRHRIRAVPCPARRDRRCAGDPHARPAAPGHR